MGKQGLTIVNTGNGKGKTTAALGQALRAAGHGLKVCIIQFIKNTKNTGEIKALASFSENIEIHTTGTGFTWEAEDLNIVKEAAIKGWMLAKDKINSDEYNLVILDEFTYLLANKILDEEEVIALLGNRPTSVHVVITGRDAPEKLIDFADLVTEMKEIKHHFRKGQKAVRGIEF